MSSGARALARYAPEAAAALDAGVAATWTMSTDRGLLDTVLTVAALDADLLRVAPLPPPGGTVTVGGPGGGCGGQGDLRFGSSGAGPGNC